MVILISSSRKNTLNYLKTNKRGDWLKFTIFLKSNLSSCVIYAKKIESHWAPRWPLQSLLPFSEPRWFLSLHLTPSFLSLCCLAPPLLALGTLTILWFQTQAETQWQLLHFKGNFWRGTLRVLVWVKCPFQAKVTWLNTWPLTPAPPMRGSDLKDLIRRHPKNICTKTTILKIWELRHCEDK